jgi:hypothetical protein
MTGQERDNMVPLAGVAHRKTVYGPSITKQIIGTLPTMASSWERRIISW